MKPIYYESLKTNNKFDILEYENHGYGGIHKGKKDLPKDEYPHTIVFEYHKFFGKKLFIETPLKVDGQVSCEIYGAETHLELNGIVIIGYWDDCISQLQKYRKIEQGIGIKLLQKL